MIYNHVFASNEILGSSRLQLEYQPREEQKQNQSWTVMKASGVNRLGEDANHKGLNKPWRC